ncbi:MAG: hopanoid biosynthesis protein HpnM [Alphaproteobacteria bacterium]|nr:hopanoid biosynthesis protein HpnM [Alphaproteobacteria bacterium]
MVARFRWARRALAALALVLFYSIVASAAEGGPRETVGGFYRALLGIMKNANQLGYAGRYQEIDAAVRDSFNLGQMMRFAVGPDWTKLTPQQQEQAVDAFSRLTISTYAARFDGFSGERLEITGERLAQGGGAIVETRLVKSDGEPVVLNYLLRGSGGAWRILDVYLSGTISELAVRRSEFSSIIRRDGFDGLIAAIERRVADLRPR